MQLSTEETEVLRQVLERGEYVCVPSWRSDVATLDGEFSARELRLFAAMLEGGVKCQS